jgi:DNA polymerase V
MAVSSKSKHSRCRRRSGRGPFSGTVPENTHPPNEVEQLRAWLAHRRAQREASPPPVCPNLEWIGPVDEELKTLRGPLFLSRVPAGFPSPADDYVDERIDLNALLIKHPAATFFLRVKGHSMTGAGIYDNDLVIVDRSLDAVSGSVVIAVIDGELTLKRLALLSGGGVELRPENPDYPVVQLSEFQELDLWGVVTDVIHNLRP